MNLERKSYGYHLESYYHYYKIKRQLKVNNSIFNYLIEVGTFSVALLSAPRRLQDLPAESKFPQRKFTGYNLKQQSMRKQPKIKLSDPSIGSLKNIF
jgi:hypothetical protein